MKGSGGEIRYSHTWNSKPWIGFLLGPFAVFLATKGVEEAPWLVCILVWLVALILGMVALGSFISTNVLVNGVGGLRLQTRLLGLPLSTLHLEPGAVRKVELDGHIARSRTSESLRLHLQLRHENGLSLITADTDKENLLLQAKLLAIALGCPLKFTGAGWDSLRDREELVQLDPVALRAEALSVDERKPYPRKMYFIAIGGLILLFIGWVLLDMPPILRYLIAGASLMIPVLFLGFLLYKWLLHRKKTRIYQRELQERNARQKKLDAIVQAAADAVAHAVASSSPPDHLHWFHAVSEINPHDLSVWFIFQTDGGFEQAVTSGLAARIDALTRDELKRGGYPAEVIQDIFVGFKTHEALRREVGDNYMALFQIKSPVGPNPSLNPDAPTSGARVS